jgi:hypothetical protein
MDEMRYNIHGVIVTVEPNGEVWLKFKSLKATDGNLVKRCRQIVDYMISEAFITDDQVEYINIDGVTIR